MSEEKFATTRYLNVKGRAEFLTRVEERLNCVDIDGEILTETERFVYALCEELDRLGERLAHLEWKEKDK